MDTQKNISPSLEDYLKTIYLLPGGGDVRLMDIAEKLGVSKPSANRAVALLGQKNLVTHTPYGPIRLTPQGSKAAKGLADRHKIIKQFLMTALQLSEGLADSEACNIEHTIHQVTLSKMAQLG